MDIRQKQFIGKFKWVFSTTKLTVIFEAKLNESHDPCLKLWPWKWTLQ